MTINRKTIESLKIHIKDPEDHIQNPLSWISDPVHRNAFYDCIHPAVLEEIGNEKFISHDELLELFDLSYMQFSQPLDHEYRLNIGWADGGGIPLIEGLTVETENSKKMIPFLVAWALGQYPFVIDGESRYDSVKKRQDLLLSNYVVENFISLADILANEAQANGIESFTAGSYKALDMMGLEWQGE